jgi:hypothetical protein
MPLGFTEKFGSRYTSKIFARMPNSNEQDAAE